MIGPIVGSGALALGGLAGCFFGSWIPERVKNTLPLIFGVITISIGATLVDKASHMHVVVMALMVGSFFGELSNAEYGLEYIIRKSITWSKKHDNVLDDAFIIQYITLISAFCFGSMGMFGAFNEGITGNPAILFTKAVLDLFSGLIFGATMGIRVSFIAVPQFIILIGLYSSANLVAPLISEPMLQDFTHCGGVIFLATGLSLSVI